MIFADKRVSLIYYGCGQKINALKCCFYAFLFQSLYFNAIL